MAKITIGKLDAGRRQLQTAIDLWFHEGDAVSTHVLAYAAYELIHYISKIRNPTRHHLLLDTNLVKPEHRVEYAKRMKEAANFFKHAKEDGEKVIEFDPKLTEGFILFSIGGVEFAGERLNVKEKAFLWWFYFDKPEYLTPTGKQILAKLRPVDVVENIRRLGKREFYDAYVAAGSQRG